MSSISEISDGQALHALISANKALKDHGSLANFIRQVLSAPGIFVFGELFDLETIQSMASGNDEAKAHYELLRIFAYGNYNDFKAKAEFLPKLSRPQEIKLKQLTIVSLAAKNRIIPYATLQEKLDINNVRDLEDLVIDCIYQGLLTGKLDQKQSILSVDETFGRDVPKESLPQLAEVLRSWSAQADVLLKNIEDRLAWAQKENEVAKKHKEEFSKKMDEMKSTIKVAMEADGGSGDNFQGGFDGDYLDDKRRKGRATKGKAPRPDERPKAGDRRVGRNM